MPGQKAGQGGREQQDLCVNGQQLAAEDAFHTLNGLGTGSQAGHDIQHIA